MAPSYNLPDGVTLAHIDERFGDDPTLIPCDRCNEFFAEDELHLCDDECLCDDCTAHCESCGERFRRGGMVKAGDGSLLCCDCHQQEQEEGQ